jgi:hypothetical protein
MGIWASLHGGDNLLHAVPDRCQYCEEVAEHNHHDGTGFTPTEPTMVDVATATSWVGLVRLSVGRCEVLLDAAETIELIGKLRDALQRAQA